MLQTLPAVPLILPSDPNYQTNMSSLKEQMSALSNEEGRTLHGFSPFILDGTTMEGEIRLPSGEIKRVKATQFTAINDETIDKIDLIQAIKEKRLVAFYYEHGVCQDVSVHHKWCDWIENEKALTVARRKEVGGIYGTSEKDCKTGLASLPEESYLLMVKTLGFESYLLASQREDTAQTTSPTTPSRSDAHPPVQSKTTTTPKKTEECRIL